jgi:hypothetical protein
MPLIRCDYSKEHISDDALRSVVKVLFDTSAELCQYGKEDALNKISIFNTPFGPMDHSTAAAEVEVRAKVTEFDKPPKTRPEVRAEWLRYYETALVSLAQELKLKAPIIFTITFEDWEVVVVSAGGSKPN